jgi:hypothetical protein
MEHSQPHIMPSIEVAITIGIVPCPESSGCPDPSAVGEVLYQGPYDPQPQGSGGVYQNFTVTIPFDEDLIGPSQLSVNRFFLIGVSGFGLVVFSGAQADFSFFLSLPRPRMERYCRVMASELRRSLFEFRFMTM